MAARLLGSAAAVITGWASVAGAQPQPSVFDSKLAVRTTVSGLTQPIGLAFLGPDDFLVLEKGTGRVKRVTGGAVVATVLDLAVNSASERGLLSIALHPDFPATPWVYLFWCESTTGADSNVAAEAPLLGNRIDRFTWDGSTLVFDRNIIRLRSFQADAGQPVRGNHDGGVIRFGHDGMLYAVTGDTGRRGQMQNLPDGPFGPGMPDDQFGGPAPDDAHMTGVVLRLSDEGSAPPDNPFYAVGTAMGGEVGANLQKIFAYGVRNSFGMAIDPRSGDVWLQENGDDSFSELNRVTPGHNSGWVQLAGPASRIAEFKAIETGTYPLTLGKYNGLQQLRFPPTQLADTPEEALSRLFVLPGSEYRDPEFSWRFEIAPGGIGFLHGRALGPQYDANLFMGAAVPVLDGGYLFRFRLTGNRRKVAVDDPRLEDRVADNLEKHSFTPPGGVPGSLGIIESESLRFGRDFGVSTDIQTGPNGNLYVVSLSRGAVYEIYRPGK